MIHSLSGGVIKDNFKHTFVKVELEGESAWYLSPTSKVAVGMRVSVPFALISLKLLMSSVMLPVIAMPYAFALTVAEM